MSNDYEIKLKDVEQIYGAIIHANDLNLYVISEYSYINSIIVRLETYLLNKNKGASIILQEDYFLFIKNILLRTLNKIQTNSIFHKPIKELYKYMRNIEYRNNCNILPNFNKIKI